MDIDEHYSNSSKHIINVFLLNTFAYSQQVLIKFAWIMDCLHVWSWQYVLYHPSDPPKRMNVGRCFLCILREHPRVSIYVYQMCIYLYLYLPLVVSISICIYLYLILLYLSIFLSISICIDLYLYLSLFVSISISLCVSLCLSMCFFGFLACLSIYLFTYTPMHLYSTNI